MMSFSHNFTYRTLAVAAMTLALAAGNAQGSDTARMSDEQLSIIRSVFTGERGEWVDLTHVFLEDTIYWPTDTRGFENIANLSALPPSGSFVVALPMKIDGGSGGPLRIVAYKP